LPARLRGVGLAANGEFQAADLHAILVVEFHLAVNWLLVYKGSLIAFHLIKENMIVLNK
jgi:hypothetical protein